MPIGPSRPSLQPPASLAAGSLRAWFAHTPTSRYEGWSREAPERPTDDVFVRSPKAARVEAALLVASGPLSPRRLVQLARLLDAAEARAIVEDLNRGYDLDRTAFRIEWVASGYRMLSRAVYAPWLERLHERRARLRLSPPSLETLVIVAHRQPVTRADIDVIRGVQSAEVLRQLIDRQLIRIVGEEDTLGRPYLYGTTPEFLETFGLRSLRELPMAEELRPPEPLEEVASEEADGQTIDDETVETEEAVDATEADDSDDDPAVADAA